jgi:hypothetical protein
VTVAPEVKRRSGYDPHQPRDRKGRWVETGADVRNSITNVVGRVVAINKGDSFHETTYDVQTSDGGTQKWETSAVDVVRNRDGSAPSVAKPGTPAAHAETGAPGVPAAAPGGTPAATGDLAGAIHAVYMPPSGTGTPQQADAVDTALGVIDDYREFLDIGDPEDVALGDLAEALAKYQTASGTDRDAAVDDVGNALNGLNLSDGATQDKVTQAVQKVLLAYHAEQIPGQESLLDANLSPVEAAVAQVYDAAPAPGKVKLSDGSALEGVQVTALKPGDKIRQRKGTLYWHWVNRPKDENGVPTDQSHPTEGTVVSVSDAGTTSAGHVGTAYGQIEVTLDDGKIVRWNKTAKVDRVIAPVEVAVDDVYDPAGGGGPKTPETAGILTEAQKIAIAQKWKLPKGSIAELQAQQAAVTQAETPTVTDLIDGGMDAEKATKEAKRLARNAQINAWRARTKLQAAIDTALAEDQGKGPTPLQKDVADGKLAKAEPEAPLALEVVSDAPAADEPTPDAAPAAPEPPAPPPIPDAVAEAAASDAAANSAAGPQGQSKPTALYNVTDAMIDQGLFGPGGIIEGHAWHDQLIATAGPNSDPIPVAHLHVQGAYIIASGWAQTIDGKAYLVEQKPDESAEEAGARMHAAAATLKAVLQFAPPDHHGVQRGIALLNGPNPQDSHWAEAYGLADFKSDAIGGNGTTTFFNGTTPDPALLAHEYGHNVDSDSHLSSQWFSTVATPSWTGQHMSWSDAISRDADISAFYQGRFTETRPGKPIVLGKGGVTDYAQVSPQEDFAESVRLWLRDRRYGKVGYDPTTGDNIRFADLFPERAKVLDARFGTKTDFNASAARKRRIAEFRASLKQDTLNADDTGKPLPWEDIDSPWAIDTINAKFGLDNATANEVFSASIKEFEAELEAENAKKAAAAAVKAKLEAAKAAKAAAAAVQSFEDAYQKGLLSKSERDKLTGRRRARAYHLRKAGVPEAEADAQARAWEQAYIAEHWPQQQGPVVEPWHGHEISPKITGGAKVAQTGNDFIDKAGTEKHPLAKQQYSAAPQAKANIAAELASRLNNPDDWETYRQYRTDGLHAKMGGPGAPTYSEYISPQGPNGEDLTALGPYEQYTEEQRQAFLDKEVSARIQMWASSSGDSNEPAVVMQMAAKDEFGLELAHPAPRLGEATYQQWQQDYYTPTVQAFYRRFLRVQYEHTQEQLAAAGLKRIKLYRGMSFNGQTPEWGKPDGKAKRPELQPINSWSSKRTVSKGFSSQYSGVVFEASIPAELIIGTASTGYGCRNEYEFVVMDADGYALANNYAGTYKFTAATQAEFEADAQQMAGGKPTVGTGKFTPH